jgi:hypothetical protein
MQSFVIRMAQYFRLSLGMMTASTLRLAAIAAFSRADSITPDATLSNVLDARGSLSALVIVGRRQNE